MTIIARALPHNLVQPTHPVRAVCRTAALATCSLLALLFGTSSTTGQSPATDSLPAVLRVLPEAEVSSPLVRVGDVLKPVGSAPKGWSRIVDKPLALLPADGRRLRLERQRIQETIDRSGLLNGPVRITGATHVGIRYVAPRPLGQSRLELPQQPLPHPVSNTPTQPASYRSAVDTLATRTPQTISNPPIDTPVPNTLTPDALTPETVSANTVSASRLPPAERNRITHMLMAHFRQTHETLTQQYDVQFDEESPGISLLDGLRAVRTLRLRGEPEAGMVEMVVQGETESKVVESVVRVQLKTLPLVVMTAQTLERGDILAARDVELVPVPLNQLSDRHLTSVDRVLGKELTRTLSRGRPVTEDAIRDPIVIDRGDMIELRSISPGIVTTVPAKSMGQAAVGEQVLVELESPKRRLHARAVAFGVAEIVTRPQIAGTSP